MSEHLRCWTIQHPEVLRTLQRDGVVIADWHRSFGLKDREWIENRRAYFWMAARLSRHVKKRIRNAPFWVWVRDKPDMRGAALATRGARVVRMELEIPKELVLISDFAMWHRPLNTGWAHGLTLRRERVAWERILNPRMKKDRDYQGVVPELRLEWLRSVSHHVAR